MRIEISAGGLGSSSVFDFQSNMQAYIANAEGVISSFKAIKNSTCDLSGGVGSLQGALDEIDQRISSETAIWDYARQVQEKAKSFIQLAERIDKQVAVMVNQNKDELYRTTPWLRPSVSLEKTPWYEEAWNWLCGNGKQAADGIKAVWDWSEDTAKKAWNGLVAYCRENWDDIVTIGVSILCTIASSIAIALIPVTGGASILLVAGVSALSGAIVAATGSITSQMKENGTVDWSEVVKKAAISAAVGAATGAIGAKISGVITDSLSSKGSTLLSASSTIVRVITGGTIGAASGVATGLVTRTVAGTMESYLETGSVNPGDVLCRAFDGWQMLQDGVIGFVNGGKSARKTPKAISDVVSDDTTDWSRTSNTAAQEKVLQEMYANGELNIKSSDLGPSYGWSSSPRISETPIELDMSFKSDEIDIDSFFEEGYMQEDAFNNLTVEDYLKNYDNYKQNGRSADGTRAQKEYRFKAIEVTADEMMRNEPGLTYPEARTSATDLYRKSAALHNPDQNAGGNPLEIHALGGARENSAYGALWKNGRSEQLHDAVVELTKNMTPEQMRSTRLNVRFNMSKK